MLQQIQQVQEFMTTFGQEVKMKPGFPSDKIMKLRVDLLAEEVRELGEAVEQRDMRGILDALTDIRYVLDGALLAFGLQGVAVEAFDAVHESNMKKLCSSTEEALATQDKYAREGIETYIQQEGKYFAVKRKEDSKILKSINWVEQDLETIVKREFNEE